MPQSPVALGGLEQAGVVAAIIVGALSSVLALTGAAQDYVRSRRAGLTVTLIAAKALDDPQIYWWFAVKNLGPAEARDIQLFFDDPDASTDLEQIRDVELYAGEEHQMQARLPLSVGFPIWMTIRWRDHRRSEQSRRLGLNPARVPA